MFEMNYLFIVFSIVFLILRIWLVEIRLKDQLGPKRRYLSRMGILLFPLALSSNFSINVLNFLILLAAPTDTIAFIIYDIPEIYSCLKAKENKLNWGWLVLERVSMHVPVIVMFFYWIFSHHIFIYDFSLIADLILAGGISSGLFLIFDPRNPFTEALDPPDGKRILFAIALSIVIYFILFKYV